MSAFSLGCKLYSIFLLYIMNNKDRIRKKMKLTVQRERSNRTRTFLWRCRGTVHFRRASNLQTDPTRVRYVM